MTADESVNGAATAAPDGAGQGEAVPASERMMGLFGLAFALGIGLIGLDLLTGGKVLGALTVLARGQAPAESD
jgi:hypothetical protein